MTNFPTQDQQGPWGDQLVAAITERIAVPQATANAAQTDATQALSDAAAAQAAADGKVPLSGDVTLTGPISIATTGSADIEDLPLGRSGSLNTGINLIGSNAGGEDESGGVDFDSTVRVNAYAYQRAESTSYAEQWRTFLMRSAAKGIFAWYKPQSGYDSEGEPLGTDWQPMAWLVAHAASNDDPLNFHNHFSIEIPDATGAVQTRLEFPFGPQGSGVDQTVRGLNHTNIKTNLSDFTIRADGSTSYSGGKVGILRVAGAVANEKILEFGTNAETGSTTGIRWRFVNNSTTESGSNAGSDFAIRRFADDGVQAGTALFMQRSTGNIALGQANTESARIAAIWGTSGHHGFFAKPSTSPGAGSAFAANLTATTDRLLDNKVAADASSRFVIFGDGKVEWGNGTTRDTNLYRTAADTLRTDDALQVGGTLAVTGAVTVPAPTTASHAATKAYVDDVPRAVFTRSTSVTLTTATPASFTWSSVVTRDGGPTHPGGPIAALPAISADWAIKATAVFAAGAGGMRYFRVYRASDDVLVAQGSCPGSASGEAIVTAVADYYGSASDTFYALAEQSSGGDLNLTSATLSFSLIART